MPKLAIACSTQVAEGMAVHTKTDRVLHARGAVMEFLLINHPLDCPIAMRLASASFRTMHTSTARVIADYRKTKSTNRSVLRSARV